MTDFKPVLTKKDFVKRYANGEFGNASPTYNRIVDLPHVNRRLFPNWLPHDNGELFHLRNKKASGETHYNLTLKETVNLWYLKDDVSQWYVSEMAPTNLTLFQGEVQRGINGLELFYTTVKKPMRDALKEEAHSVAGIVANTLLKHFLDNNSYEWLHDLLENYPDHVIEFSCYDKCWGTVPRFNSVFWEVRKY